MTPEGTRIGCCGFAMAQRDYYLRFSVLEVQQTFYDPPNRRTLERWRAEAPAGFEFTLKAWQLITHEPSSPTYRRLKKPIPEALRARYGSFKPTDEVMAAWHKTLAAARALDARIMVFQCPASFTESEAHIANMRAFFAAIRHEAGGLRLCWEPRGPWPRATLLALCRELGLLYVVDPFKNEPLPGEFRYFRLHGRDGYHYRYTDEDLHALAEHCRGTTFCMFNNTAMVEDATRFRALLMSR